jgi:hypothetical protein
MRGMSPDLALKSAAWHALWAKVDFLKRAIRLCPRSVRDLEAVPPVLFANRLVVICRPVAVLQPDAFDLVLGPVRDAVSNKPIRAKDGAGGGSLVYSPSISR